MNSIMKNKASGYKVMLTSTLFSALALICYLIFGTVASTVVISIVLCLAADIALTFVIGVYEGFFTDYIQIAKVAMLTAALGLFATDSIGDVTEFITGVGMYGNSSNVYYRAAIMIVMLISIVLLMVASLKDRVK